MDRLRRQPRACKPDNQYQTGRNICAPQHREHGDPHGYEYAVGTGLRG